MASIDFSHMEKEERIVINDFESSLSYMELSLSRLSHLQQYFIKICAEYKKNATKKKLLNESSFRSILPEYNSKCIAPGMPGGHNARIYILSGLENQLCVEFSSFATFIQGSVLGKIEDYILNKKGILECIARQYNDQLNFLRLCRIDLDNAIKNLNNAAKSVEKAHKAKETAKIDKIDSAVKKLKEKCVEYQKCAKDLHFAIGKYNNAHYNFVTKAQKFVKNLNEMHQPRLEIIKEIIKGYFAPAFSNFVRSYHDLSGQFTNGQADWIPDFQRFMSDNGIVRTMLKPRKYVQKDGIVCTGKRMQLDSPILIGTVTSDFKSNEPNKMSVKEGERVCLYENLYNKWVLAKNANGEIKYLPSSCLKIEETRIALVTLTQLKNSHGALDATVGDLFMVIEGGDDHYICQGINNEQGTISKYNVIIEFQKP